MVTYVKIFRAWYAMSLCDILDRRRVASLLVPKSHASIAPFSDSVYSKCLESSTTIFTMASTSCEPNKKSPTKFIQTTQDIVLSVLHSPKILSKSPAPCTTSIPVNDSPSSNVYPTKSIRLGRKFRTDIHHDHPKIFADLLYPQRL